MMRRMGPKYLFVNVAILCLAIAPMSLMMIWLYNLLQGRYAHLDLGLADGSGFAYAVTYIIPVGVGGLLHAILVAAIFPQSWTPIRRRIAAAVLAVVVVPTVLLVLGQPWEPLMWFALAIIAGLVVYGLVMRLPKVAAISCIALVGALVSCSGIEEPVCVGVRYAVELDIRDESGNSAIAGSTIILSSSSESHTIIVPAAYGGMPIKIGEGVPSGTYSLTVTREGYRPATISGILVREAACGIVMTPVLIGLTRSD